MSGAFVLPPGKGGVIADILKNALYGIHRKMIALCQKTVETVLLRRFPEGNIPRA